MSPVSDQGVDSTRYQIIPRTLIFVFSEDKVLLIKGAPTKRLWANRYNGIGGHLEKGEDVMTGARRELKEETGLSPVQLRLCGTVMVDTGQAVGIGLFVFVINEWSGQIQQSSEGELEWVSIRDLHSIPCVEDIPVLLQKIIEMDRKAPPFAAIYIYNEEGGLEISFG